MSRSQSEGTLSNDTPFKMRLGFAVVILAAVAGFHPWAIAQIRSVVQEENRVVVLQQEQRQDRQFNDLERKIVELVGEVRALKAVVVSGRGR